MQKDWVALLTEICKVYGLLDPESEWNDADIHAIAEEFDPWNALREIAKKLAGAPAAGSAERATPNCDQQLGLHYEISVWYVVDGYEARFEHERNGLVTQAHGQTVIEAVMNLEKNMAAQAGTDTDVAKEE